ncbi:MAG: hypothetical protein ACK58T_02670, partial [Phycisphaerae bacterium]
MSQMILKTLSYPKTRYSLTIQNCHWNQSCPMSRSNRMSHYRPNSHWIQSIRCSLSCRFVRRSQSFLWIQEDCRIPRIHCYRSIPMSRS